MARIHDEAAQGILDENGSELLDEAGFEWQWPEEGLANWGTKGLTAARMAELLDPTAAWSLATPLVELAWTIGFDDALDGLWRAWRESRARVAQQAGVEFYYVEAEPSPSRRMFGRIRPTQASLEEIRRTLQDIDTVLGRKLQQIDPGQLAEAAPGSGIDDMRTKINDLVRWCNDLRAALQALKILED